MRLRAALDIGTNSTLLLVAMEKPEGGFIRLFEPSAVTRLGEGLRNDGCLKPEAVNRTLDAIGKFFAEAKKNFPSLEGAAVGTSALRDAQNPELFLHPCQKRFGFVPDILSGKEEARTTFLGASSDVDADTALLNLDVGGGSAEISAGTPEKCQFAHSLDLGCVRLAEQFDLLSTFSRNQAEQARKAASALLAPALEQASSNLLVPAMVSASGGTATTFAMLARKLEMYDATKVHAFKASMTAMNATIEELAELTAEGRSRKHHLSLGRAAVLPAGLIILHEALRLLNAETFRVTTYGLRHGLLARLQTKDIRVAWKL